MRLTGFHRNVRKNFHGFCFICIESAAITQSIRGEYFQKSMKIAKLFSHKAFIVHG